MEKKITKTSKLKSAAKPKNIIKPKKVVKSKSVVKPKVSTKTKKVTKPRIVTKSVNVVKPKSASRLTINKRSLMGGHVDTHFAFAILLLLAGGLAMYVWIGVYSFDMDFSVVNNLFNRKSVKQEKSAADLTVSCKPHYYDGEAQIKGWKADKESEKGIVVQIDMADVNKLPVVEKSIDRSMLNLIGASQKVQKDLEKSNSANPTTITIKGYATACDASLPVASLKSVNEVLKKS